MSNSTAINDEMGHRMRPPEINVAAAAATSSPSLLSVVIVCMTILAVCAFIYFAIRCYFDERRWRASAMLCKCLPPASSASLVECGNSCRYVERRAVHAAVQTSSVGEPPAASSNCWTMSDVRTSEARRTGCTFSSPVANNEAIPNWRPPATGSSHRQTNSNHYRLAKSSQRHKHRHHRQAQRRHYLQQQQQQHEKDEACQPYPLRRSHAVNMRQPSIYIQSPSSSDSYSVLTMSHSSKTAIFNKELTTVTFSDEEDDRLLHQQQQHNHHRHHHHHLHHSNHHHHHHRHQQQLQLHQQLQLQQHEQHHDHNDHHNDHQFSKSGLSDSHSYVSTCNPYHPRYNTPVSEINNNDVEVVVDVEEATETPSLMTAHTVTKEIENGQEMFETKPQIDHLEANEIDEHKWTATTAIKSGSFDDRTIDGRSTENGTSSTTVRLVDGATQSCPPSVIGVEWYGGVGVGGVGGNNLKRCQVMSRTSSSCSLNTVSAGLLPLEMVARSGLPLKGTFPSYEILPGGRLVTRWTQTDNASVISLDWDNYECERIRTEIEPEVEEDDIGGQDYHHRLTNLDEGVEGMTGMSSTTLLMVSHDSAETTLQASRISHRSASSPYVLCFECSEDFSVNDERRNSATYFVPRRTSSSPHPRRQRLSGPPTPPLPMNLLPPSPLQSSCHHPQPDGQDGRSSKAVKPRRK